MSKISFITSVALLLCLFVGCQPAIHYREASGPIPVGTLDTYQQDNAEIPVRVQVVNFFVKSVDAPYSEAEKKAFVRSNGVIFANDLQRELGKLKVFSEIRRTVSAEPNSADYIISGTIDFSQKYERGMYTHKFTTKQTIHLRVMRAKDNVQILDKDFVEENTDEASRQVGLRVKFDQPAFLESITVEIKKCVAQDIGILKTKAPLSHDGKQDGAC
jgi:hypothetical protein